MGVRVCLFWGKVTPKRGNLPALAKREKIRYNFSITPVANAANGISHGYRDAFQFRTAAFPVQLLTAMASTSTRTFLGSLETSTQERAGQETKLSA